MRGQIIGRGKSSWLLRVTLGRDATGKRRIYNETFHGNKKAAEKRLTAILSKRDKGTFIEPSSETLDHYLDRWLEDAAKASVRQRTHEGYKDILARYIRPRIGLVKLSNLTPLEIQAAYNKMIADGLSPRTVRYAHAVLRSALNQAVKWQMLYRNPATFVDLPRLEQKEMQALGPDEVADFLKSAYRAGVCACYPKRPKPKQPAVTQCRHRALFSLAVTSGLRPGEYLALQWSDVDLDAGSITVRRSLAPDTNGGWTLGGAGLRH